MHRAYEVYGLNLLIVGGALCTFGLSAHLFGFSIRPGHLLAVFLCVASFPLIFVSLSDGKVHKATLFLALWLILSFVSSSFALDPMLSLRHWLDLTLAVVLFFLALSWRLERLVLARPPQMLWIGVALAGGGLLMFILQSMGLLDPHSIFASFIGDQYGYFRVYMTMHEPNLYGATMMIFALGFLSEWKDGGVFVRGCILLFYAGLILAFSRGPLVGFAAGLLVYFFCKHDWKRLLLSLFLFAAIAVAYFVYTYVGSTDFSFLNRADSIASRIVFAEYAWWDILKSPYIGNGIYSFSFMHLDALLKVGGKEGGEAWLGSFPLAVLHDTGLIGFSLLVAFFALVLRNAFKAIQTGYHMIGMPKLTLDRATGWFSAGVAILVSSMATTAHSMGIFWVLFAIIYSIPSALRISLVATSAIGSSYERAYSSTYK